MYLFLLSFLISFTLSISIIKFRYGLDRGRDSKSHAVHSDEVSRMGGIAIFVAIFLMVFLYLNQYTPILIATFPIFTFGFLEDRYHMDITYVKKIVFLFLSSIAITYFSKEYAIDGGLIQLSTDADIERYIAIGITLISFVGFSSAVNFIDGLHGYSMGVVLITLSIFSYIFYNNGLLDIFYFSILILGAIFGFFILNFPQGKIFLGDMGAHFIGFIVVYLSIYLTNHTDISLWFPLTALSIPVIETFVTIYRRRERKRREGIQFSISENGHLHHLILGFLKKYLSVKNLNATTSSVILLWHLILNLISFYYRYTYEVLILIFIINIGIYLYLYRKLQQYRIEDEI